ncbi:uncharacterized protein LOC129915043 [Episyrphus balteatus]|uniref:uncharacterized protein LOC129915043 n=1 Tax=Episyrphus balteatus TaxID=286459 RepID=UPI0024868753|nr:uncharacterized protein LOC129915043 [Episyrphus balteatus]
MYRGLQFILFNYFVLCIWSVKVNSHKTDWEYVLLRFESNSTNPDIANFNVRTLRVSRGLYAINGTLFVGKDLDNTYSVDFRVYRSASGNSDFKATAYEIPTTTFYKFMTSFYVKMVQKDLQNCSNLPQHKDEFEGPLTAGVYECKKCIVTNDRMPGHAQPGLYKSVIHLFGDDIELWLSLYFEVSTKSFI